jgi:CRP-like cAMP-binding protein
MLHAGMTISLLKHRRIWQDLEEEVRLRLVGAGVRERHPRGRILWGPDDDLGEAQLVIEGRLRVCRFDELGREIVVGILEEGELVTQEEAAQGATGYVEALEPCEILRVRLAELEAILDDEDPDSAAALRSAREKGASRD